MPRRASSRVDVLGGGDETEGFRMERITKREAAWGDEDEEGTDDRAESEANKTAETVADTGASPNSSSVLRSRRRLQRADEVEQLAPGADFGSSNGNSKDGARRQLGPPPGAGEELLSSTPLQIALYFNLFLSPVWFVALVVVTDAQEDGWLGGGLRRILYLVCAVLEAPRLYIGYHGNLRERPPALAGFLLLTLLTMALVAFLGFSEPIPMEFGLDLVFLLFLLVEGWTAFLTIAYMSREQAARFHAKRVMLDAATDMLAETTI